MSNSNLEATLNWMRKLLLTISVKKRRSDVSDAAACAAVEGREL